MKRFFTGMTLFILLYVYSTAYGQKKPLGHEDILGWNRITEQRISNNGELIVYKQEPWKGDPVLFIKNRAGKELAQFPCATRSAITNDSKHVVFVIKAPEQKIRELKLKKTKKEEMPKDMLGIWHRETNTTDTVVNLKAYELPGEWSGFIAFQAEEKTEDLRPKPAPGDDRGTEIRLKEEKELNKEEKSDAKKKKEESDKNGRALYLLNMDSGDTVVYPFVKEFHFASKGKVLVFISTGDDEEFLAGLYAVNIENMSSALILEGDADVKQLTMNETGDLIAFLADKREEKERKKKAEYNLYASANHQMAGIRALSGDQAIPAGMEISANGSLKYSPSGNRLFFGIAPIPTEKDSTILEEELPVVDVWHWNEPELQTVQINNRSRKMKETFLAVYDQQQEKVVILQDESVQNLILAEEGDGDIAFGTDNLPYAVQTMWEGSPEHIDLYEINLKTGQKQLIKQNLRIRPLISPKGKYLYWFNPMDTTWTTREIATGQEYCIVTPTVIQTADELNDVPNPPGTYGYPVWLHNDESALLYDRYNIWQVDPRGASAPVNLTKSDPTSGLVFRLIDFDRQESSRNGLNPEKITLLSGHNEISREDGYFSWKITSKKPPKALVYGAFSLSNPLKAKNADILLFTKENFTTFPDLQTSDLNFKNPVKVSDANPQQQEFNWGTAELVKWTSLDGRALEGLLYKPENFDPNRKYPMIVNFYEKSSQELYNYKMPERHRSTIDYHYYTSNGYLVFNPDVYYKTGYPGEDAFNCVMPGITALIGKGFVDEKAIGAQGHSWGGYQVAYLATRTQLFAAIESGAPVVNMFSAYGGIRWGSGMNRSFQYEHTQSRIGKSIWESPLRYVENSPVFTLDKITTPILIMANDDDGAVPWYQGIEFFTGLRRLGKPAWLLNYNNADHWPTRLEDKHDFQIRMAQFFDHYLKGEPMPVWMEKGIPATEKGLNLGYDYKKTRAGN